MSAKKSPPPGLYERLIPWRIRNRVTRWQQDRTFRRAFPLFQQDPDRALAAGSNLLSELVFGWGNTSFSAQTEYLERCMVEVAKSTGPILECGSGLSTLVLGTVAQRNNLKMWSFENSPEWALRVRTQLEKYGITSVKVCDTPLRSYGEYNWYDSSGESLPNDFGLVICDGPPAQTPGGRYGMYPQVKGRLRPDCKIMVDDADREQEREICARWKQENGGRFEIFGETKRFIVFDCGSQG